ncbi:MAG: hypothetical protein ABW221_25905 [Vicinamibacteria bacterium]
MDVAILLVFAAVFVVGGTKVVVSERREIARRRARDAVAKACGLTHVHLADERAVVGWHGSLYVRMETVGVRARHVRVAIGGLVRSLHVVPVKRGQTGEAHVFADRDVKIGDAAFDAALLLQGPTATVRGLFTADARARARDVFVLDAVVRISGGSLLAEFLERRGRPVPTEDQLRALLALAHALEPGASDLSRLVEVAHGDPVPTVRAAALETLLQETTDVGRTRGTLREALRDPDAAIRLRAANGLGDEGRPTLHTLAADASVEDGTRAAAIVALGGYLTFPRALPLLESALSAGRTRTVCALLKVMGRGSVREAQVLLSVLERAGAPEASPEADAIVAAAQDALLDTGAPVPEDVFLRALASSAGAASRAAVRGLERFGTARAVPPLRDAEGRADLARAAREAIVAIRSRLTGATPGQVSLAGGDAGQVSVVDSPHGRLALEEEDT